MRARSTGAGNQSQQASFSGKEHVENCAVEPSEYLKHQLTPSPGLVALAKAPQKDVLEAGVAFLCQQSRATKSRCLSWSDRYDLKKKRHGSSKVEDA